MCHLEGQVTGDEGGKDNVFIIYLTILKNETNHFQLDMMEWDIRSSSGRSARMDIGHCPLIIAIDESIRKRSLNISR